MPQRIPYFVSGHTADGYVNYLSSNLINIDNIIILKHGSETASAIIEKLIDMYTGEQLEVISDPMRKNKFAGLIVRNKKQAVLTDSIITGEIKDAHIIDLQMEENISESLLKEACYKEAYSHFKKGLTIHDDLEKVYITEMDFSKADSITYAFINELLKNSASGNKQAHVYERLFGTNTPDGMLNHVRELISPLGRVYHIKGRAGTGKSVFMKKVLHACIRHGLDCELYYCSFDSKSIDMVIVRELDFCIFDSTSPHEFFPEGDHEEIIDLYQLAVTPGTDEKYNTQIQELTANYKSEMKKGLESLKKINSLPLAKVNTIKRDETIEVILDKWGIEQ